MDTQNKNETIQSTNPTPVDPSRAPVQGTPFRRPFFRPLRRPKQCIFCVDLSKKIDLKNPSQLYRFVSDRSKILSRRITGLCAYHQRHVAKKIKVARFLSLIK